MTPLPKHMSSTAQAVDYICDITKNWFSFWKENADKVCNDEEDITGKIVIVTGSNTGIGKMIALQLAKRGATVVMACRDIQKGQEAMDYIKTRLGSQEVKTELMKLDLGDLESIRNFVKAFESKYHHLNILVNNAGFMDTNGVVKKTKDGFEQHIGVNHLGPFLLTKLLVGSLKKGSPSRVVCLSSSNVVLSPLDMEDLMMEKQVKMGDHGKEQYSISKLANSVCINKLTSTLGPDSGIKVFQLCPGYVNSDVFRNEKGLLKVIRSKVSLAFVGLTPHQGSETAVFCCVAKSVASGENSGKGEIYRFKQIWQKGDVLLKAYEGTEQGETLYKLSEEWVNQHETSVQ